MTEMPGLANGPAETRLDTVRIWPMGVKSRIRDFCLARVSNEERNLNGDQGYPFPIPEKHRPRRWRPSRPLSDSPATWVGAGMRLKIFLPLALALLSAIPAAGQIRVEGRVIDDFTEMPIPGAQVALLARDGSVLRRTSSDDLGTFHFEVRRVSAVRIRAARLGYEASTTPLLYFDGRNFFQVEVRLDPDAILLAPLEVIAWSGRPDDAVLEGFRRRLKTGLGTYITREEFEKRRPSLVTDLLREVPGLEVAGTGSGTRPVVRMVRASNRNCSTQIFVDGFLVNRRVAGMDGYRPLDFRIDDAVSPASVEGIEIYRGVATVPAEFLNPDAVCGVIAIWTRRGGDG